MAAKPKYDIRDNQSILRYYKREVLREMRKEGRRLRKYVAAAAPKKTGTLAKKLKVRGGWDARGPWVRVTTTARRTTKNAETGEVTTFRYGLATQQQEHYLQRGLQRTPRR